MRYTSSFRQVYWEDAQVGFELPPVHMDITLRKCVLHVAAGWDYMPGHHDAEYARSQGTRTVFLNTLFHQSFVDRVVTDWAGPRTFINRRKIAMKAAICAGDHIIGTARVTRVYRHESGHGRVDLDVWIRNQDGADCCVADATVTLPSRADGAG